MAFKIVKKIKTKIFIQRFKHQKRKLPKQIGNIGLNHFLESFRMGGFNDSGFKRWAPRKARTKRNAGRALLVDSGALRNSLGLKTARWQKIRVASVGIPYASRHNRGLAGMPQRQFIGNSGRLNAKITRRIKTEIKSIFK